ncbi:MAG: tetratricopeptide repeat protein [Myxococcales bacterium]|nr:tetratricopeptide repeat protein [Myxococcales bacterium]
MNNPQAKALELVRRAHQRQMAGALDDAVSLYQRSLDLCPTAEAHTYLGWTYSFQGRVEEAIAECKKAIVLDPGFGNPYNDIGAYLIEEGDIEGAIPWLDRAKRAERYEPRHFPFLNLGRIYLVKGQLGRALVEFQGALEIDPLNKLARQAIDEISTRLN